MHALVFAAALGLVPPGPPAPPAESALREEAREYAKQVNNVAESISFNYVRPVDRKAVLAAALAGLYEAARKPVPARLREQLDRAGEDELLGLLARAREEAGPVEELKGHGALLASLKALPRVLDPYAVVYDKDEAQRAIEPEQHGPGLTLERPPRVGPPRPPTGLPPLGPGFQMPSADLEPPGPGPWRVAAVLPGGPAQRAGLRPGDRVTHIDGRPLNDPAGDPGALAHRLFGGPTGDAGRPVRVTFRRGSEAAAREATLTPGPFKLETVWGVRRTESGGWDYLFDRPGKVGLIRVGPITKETPQELEAALASLRQAGARGLLLDLRACPGGWLLQATEVVRRFAADGAIATVRDREGRVTRSYEAGGGLGEPACPLPMVVLTGRETVGGGELIAAALQDLRRAKVAGQRTAGKAGVMEEPLPLVIPGHWLKLSTSLFVRPSGRNLQRYADSTPTDDWGVRPDAGLAVALTPDLAAKLQEWWRWQTLRPAGDREALPLDDPENDPVAQAAVRALGK